MDDAMRAMFVDDPLDRSADLARNGLWGVVWSSSVKDILETHERMGPDSNLPEELIPMLKHAAETYDAHRAARRALQEYFGFKFGDLV